MSEQLSLRAESRHVCPDLDADELLMWQWLSFRLRGDTSSTLPMTSVHLQFAGALWNSARIESVVDRLDVKGILIRGYSCPQYMRERSLVHSIMLREAYMPPES